LPHLGFTQFFYKPSCVTIIQKAGSDFGLRNAEFLCFGKNRFGMQAEFI